MIGRLALLATLAVAFAAAIDKPSDEYEQKYVPDKEFLKKQKLVYDVLYHYNQPELNKDLYEIGLKYNLKENIDSYNDKNAVEHFLKHLEHGLMPHDAVYSVFYYPRETLSVYRLLYHAKDFETFYKTALYLRNRVNHDMFAYTFYLAVIHRPDTEYVRLPALYEIAPYMFYNSELMEKAHHVRYFGEKVHNATTQETYIIPYNYSGFYLNDEYNYENMMNYLTEDIGWNEYYFYFRNEYPFLLNTKEFGLYDKYRGEEYLYGHKQILARYNLERLANGLGSVEHFDFHGEFYPGYYPTLTYPNGLPFPSRPFDATFPKNKRHDISNVLQYERRIVDNIDAGFVLNKDGQKVDIYTPAGLNLLGNVIEGNADSSNTRFYGSVDELMRRVLGFNVEPATRYQAQPSALQHFATSLRDPAFYRIYFKLLHYYQKYQHNQGHYKAEDVQFPELSIESVEVDKLVTYFDYFDSSISHGLVARSKEEADSMVIKARQMRLNHRPFALNFTVNAKKDGQVAVKVFIGPKYDIHGRELDFDTVAHDYFYEIDNFIHELKAGENKFSRNHMDFTVQDQLPYEEFYKRVLEALKSGTGNFNGEKRIYGFPERLLLPKGNADGLRLQMFVHVAPVNGEPLHYKSRIFGNSFVDNRAFGYPLDRSVIEHFFHASNMLRKEIRVYHYDH